MTNRYMQAFDWLMNIEGFYSNHPKDSGGETAWGISKRWWPQYWLMGRPSRDVALGFYWTEFWVPLRCDEILNPDVARELFEGAVLSGKDQAVKWLQQAVNAILVQGAVPLVVDGKLGPKTLYTANWYGQRYPAALFNAQNIMQGAFLVGLNSPDFVRGWLAKRIQSI